MLLTLRRYEFTKEYCEGKLYVDGKFFCDTVEDHNKDYDRDGRLDVPKVYGKTAIPFGTFKITIDWSPKFKRNMLHILDVPYFEGIRIHNGKDASWSAGCLLVGHRISKGKLDNDKNVMFELEKLVQIAINKGEKVEITVV